MSPSPQTSRGALRPVRLPALLLCALPAVLGAQDSVRVTFDGFVDAYVAYDANRPRTLDRQYTTQPARHAEFNVNLAHLGATVQSSRVRARLALQAGTSVQSNYAGEPTLGDVSGPELARLLQEAYVGYRVGESLWIDAGVFFSHMGTESWVSADNIAYTRSLVADYSPYYSTGVRAQWAVSPTLSARVDVTNGWQNISETNTDKSVGARLDWTPREGRTLSAWSYAGNEAGSRLRLFNGVGLVASVGERTELLAQLDYGVQDAPDGAAGNGDRDAWVGGTLIARYALAPTVRVVGRVEAYRDREELVITTPAGVPGLDLVGGSVGLDVSPQAGVLWRTELRGYRSADDVFRAAGADGGFTATGGVFVTSLALRF